MFERLLVQKEGCLSGTELEAEPLDCGGSLDFILISINLYWFDYINKIYIYSR